MGHVGKKRNSTRKQRGKRPIKHTWRVIHISGAPFERGYQHGRLLRAELRRIFDTLPFLVEKFFNMTIDKYYTICRTQISPTVKNEFPEFYEEIRGICHGAKNQGLSLTVDQLLAWNAVHSMREYLKLTKKNKIQHCSAFIATGDATTDGQMVMAHNTHCDFVSGSFFNIIMYVTPSTGLPFVMQTCAGFLCSASDFFVTAAGIIGSETTISMAKYLPEFQHKYPFFCRIRQAMQYGRTLDEYAALMVTKNAGDYPCSWLFGDTRTGEIMLCEIGLKLHNIQRTKNGIFYGMNSAMDRRLRTQETLDKSHNDITTSSGARNKRLHHLLHKKYYGKLNCQVAKRILGDHYDEMLHKVHPSNRTVCNHSYEGVSQRPHGAQDGKVVDTDMAQKMEFWGIFGSSCGKAFSKKQYINEQPMNREWEPHLVDYPKGVWEIIRK